MTNDLLKLIIVGVEIASPLIHGFKLRRKNPNEKKATDP